MNEESAKKALIYLLIAVGIFIAFRPKQKSEQQTTSMPLQNAKNSSGRIQLVLPTGNSLTIYEQSQYDNAMTCIKAFINAYNADESESVLTDLNNEIKNQYGLYLIKTKSDITVYDFNDNKVLTGKI
jgi:hypothetical protein